ncbi:hypothetical protein [Streptomyces sp. NPDC050145]|uniref:hypothetical protein n=1 Tax=Streptomyces sp. NPDC050145 TaxID=3365602 RepID=UPI003792AE14
MSDVRVVLIGGTSHTGKSTVSRRVADRLGFVRRSTDGLARHPGRPWPTPDRPVPPHVDEHYRSLTVDELVESVLGHYGRLWPRIEELIAERAPDGLVLEGSALWPAQVARLVRPRVCAVWLSAGPQVLAARVHASSRYAHVPPHERVPIDRFLARTLRYQELMLDSLHRLGLDGAVLDGAQPADDVAEQVRRRV